MASTNGIGVVAEKSPEPITIKAPDFRTLTVRIRGTAPYMQARFSEKARQKMMDTMAAGSTAAKGRKKEPRDFEEDYRGAMHLSQEGWNGIPATAFRNAAISACKIVGFMMTRAKLAVFVEHDGIDIVDGTPLIRIIDGEPESTEMAARNDNGSTDIRIRPMWRTWGAILRIRYDADLFTETDVANLILRAGLQVGVGEGRPDSKKSNGMGFGTFEIVTA